MPKDGMGLPPYEQARVVDAYARTALDAALAAGLSLDCLGFADGLPATLPVGRYIDLLEQSAARSGDPCFGLHVGERMRPSTFATYSHVVLSSPTFAEAVVQTRRFEGLAHDLGRTELLVEGDVATYRWHCPWLARQPSRHLPESIMAGIFTFANWLACQSLPLYSLSFPHARDECADLGEYRRIFGLDPTFDASITQARFPAAVLNIEIPNADRAMFPVVERHAAQLLAQRDQELQGDGIIPQVRRCIADQLAFDQVCIGDVARTLNRSVRSLQRKLKDEGASFQAILDETRAALALVYLRDHKLSAEETSFLLAYRDPNSFYRAFSDWTGMTPAEARAAHII